MGNEVVLAFPQLGAEHFDFAFQFRIFFSFTSPLHQDSDAQMVYEVVVGNENERRCWVLDNREW